MADTIITRQDNKAVIRPAGEVVASAVPELRATLRGALGEGVREVEFDLAGVSMVDSTGIGLLISTHNSLLKLGGHLAVTHVSPDIFELFRTMRIHQHFSVCGAQGSEK